MNGFIYKIANRVNNKVYIGQTRFTIDHRFKQHVKNFNIEHRTQPLYKAMAKYGIENFSVECLEECDVKDLDEREIFWIAKYDSFRNGYNATLGGQSGGLYTWTDSQYEEMRNLYLSGFTIKSISQMFNVSNETIRCILKSMNVKIRNNPMDINRIEKDRLIEEYRNGATLVSLGKKLGTDRETIKRFLVKENVPLKDHSRLVDNVEIHDKIISDYLDGERYKNLEVKYHTDMRTLKRILVMHGIDIKANRGFRHAHRNGLFLDDSQCLDVIRQYNDKVPVKDIAKKHGVHITTIYEILKRYHVECNRYNCSKSVLPLKDKKSRGKTYSNKASCERSAG